MSRYADRTRCPDCRSLLPASPTACPQCELPLSGELPRQLFETLTAADALLTRIRETQSVTVPAGTPAAAPPSTPPVAVQRPTAPATPPRGLTVPQVLLGLGALCVLVAAAIFAAVAWSWMSMTGRTVALLTLTLACAAGSWFASGRRLRGTAETFFVIAAGLVVVDVDGAESAGWFGGLGGGGVTLVCALILLALSVPTMLLARRLHERALVSPQLVTVFAIGLGVSGAIASWDRPAPVLALGALVAIGTGLAGRVLGLAPLRWTSLVLAGALVVALGVWSLDALAAPEFTLTGVWSGGGGAAMVAVGVLIPLLLLPADGRNVDSPALPHLLGVGACAALVPVLLPLVDEKTDIAIATVLVVLLLAAALTALLPGRWWVVPVAPGMIAFAAAVGGLFFGLLMAGVSVLGVAEPFSAGPGLPIEATDIGFSPVWLVALTAGVLAALASVARRVVEPDPTVDPQSWRSLAPWAGIALGIAALGMLVLWGLPLAVVVATLTLTAGAASLWYARSSTIPTACVAGALGAAALASALPSDVLTLFPLTGWTVAALFAALRPHQAVRALGGGLLPIASGALLLTSLRIADVPVPWWGLITVCVLAAVALALPRLPVEIAAALFAAATCLSSLFAMPSFDGDAVANRAALMLTVAGSLVLVHGLVHRSSRWVLPFGGVLLAMATWCRLAVLGVEAPEAYTLPSAVVLTAVGVVTLLREPEARTRRTLLAGLLLGTVPSLLWVLADTPFSLRGLLLGLGCLTLVLTGSALRWRAPVLVGSVVGAILVLNSLAPYADQIPPWISIGTAGALLLGVGVTWESRMRDLRSLRSRLADLR